MKLVIEPINIHDIPGFYLNTARRRRWQILDEVGASERVRAIRHLPRAAHAEGELAATMEKYLARIGHIQLADNPGRQ